MFERMRWGERELPQAAGRMPPAIAAAVVAIAMILTLVLMAGCQSAPEASSESTPPDAGDKAPDSSSTAPLGQDVPGGTSSGAPSVGDMAPDFSLPNTNGGHTSLSEVLTRNDSVVLVFYRGFF